MASHFLDDTFGVCFIGVVIAAELHGVACVQAWYYFTHQNDGWPLKLYVITVLCLDTVHQALITHTVYIYLITNYNNPPQLNNLLWSLLVEVLFNGLTALLVQSFLTVRIWRLSKRNKWLTGTALSLVLAEFGCVLAYVGMSLRLHTFAEITRLKALSIAVNALAASGDVFITSILCFLLLRSRTGFKRSDTMIKKLVLFFVNTGLITSLFAIASLISITVAPTTFIYILFFFCMGRLYSNSLLAILNAREMIRGKDNTIFTTKDMPTSWRAMEPMTKSTSTSSPLPELVIKIDTEQESAVDEDAKQRKLSRSELKAPGMSGDS
ncbi:hypothetical protein FB451DRAFT_1270178 [Mycena latifolia]|nr:hypothetical protein FB451DRAFT_1270178 [Mycena latifolia]